MGFWHTGYIEFHEPVGYDESFKPLPQRYRCSQCDKDFSSTEELRDHRFSEHPMKRPLMFLQGRELGSQTEKITQQLEPSDLFFQGCDRAIIDGDEVSVDRLPHLFAAKTRSIGTFDICKVTLCSASIEAEFVFDICVASMNDLKGVEEEFVRIAKKLKLDTRSIDDFISSASKYQTAIGYCDGVCSYLYGVLAKEKAVDSSLPYEAYLTKFSNSCERLAAYDRPLAKVIRSLVSFHFNHFHVSSSCHGGSRVGSAAARFYDWLNPTKNTSVKPIEGDFPLHLLEKLVTDWETEKIVQWSTQPLEELAKVASEIEMFLRRDLSEFDKAKLHILLGEVYAACENKVDALKHAKILRNNPSMEKWAEALISNLSEE